jgi:F-type H+-transporting ATPase subunit b
MVDELLRQLGELFLGSVPTILIFLILVLSYRFVLHGPLQRVFAERRALTAGAMEKAHAAIAAAEAKSQEYEAKLRAARAEIFRNRELRIQQLNAQRDKALESARLAAQERAGVARKAIEAEATSARGKIEAASSELASNILEVILPSRAEGVR